MTEFLMARPIPADSWLNEPRWTLMRAAVLYAGGKSAAIPALAQISPEDAVMLYTVMRRGVSLELSRSRERLVQAEAERRDA